VRGAGQGFPGIVTLLHLAMQPHPRDVLASVDTLPLARAAEAAAWVQDALGEKPQSLETLMLLAQDCAGQPVAMLIANAFGSTADEARASLARFAASDLAKEALFKVEAEASSLEKLLTDPANPMTGHGLTACAVDSIWTAKPADALAAAAEQPQRAASPLTHAVIAFKSGRPLPAVCACSRIDRAFVGLYAAWPGTERLRGNAADFAWLRKASQALQPFASGHHINAIEIEATPQEAADCSSVKAWNRQAEVRHRHDPERLFHGFLGVA